VPDQRNIDRGNASEFERFHGESYQAKSWLCVTQLLGQAEPHRRKGQGKRTHETGWQVSEHVRFHDPVARIGLMLRYQAHHIPAQD